MKTATPRNRHAVLAASPEVVASFGKCLYISDIQSAEFPKFLHATREHPSDQAMLETEPQTTFVVLHGGEGCWVHPAGIRTPLDPAVDRKSTRLNSSH